MHLPLLLELQGVVVQSLPLLCQTLFSYFNTNDDNGAKVSPSTSTKL